MDINSRETNEDKMEDIFLMFSVVVMIILGLLVTNSIYLEKFYIKNKKEKLVELGKILVDPKYVIDFQNLEMHSNVAILIKKSRTLQTGDRINTFQR